ncbi:MAG: YgcG family protein [Bradyrhizobiaceae bacterium]|nr:YgcG family protein [Bradyrhizobiaceae bacterium]
MTGPSARLWRAASGFAGLGVGLTILCSVACAQTLTFPTLTARIVDEANILDSATRTALTEKLAALETKTGDQLVIVTLKSLQGTSIEDFGYQLGRHWGIGQKDKNNGALLIVAPNERKVRIEVGYGLEGTLTDALSKVVIENAIVPRFRAGDFAGGITRGTDDIIQVLSGDAEAFKQQVAAKKALRNQPTDDWYGLLSLLFWIGVVLFITFVINRPRRGRRGSTWIVPIPIGYGRSGGFSGGGVGGGFSGGGGSFGGGGSSGSW